MNKLFAELRRRNVFRVAGVYAVVGWLLIQVIVAVKSPLHLPAWTDTFFVVLVLAGFPIALLFAWAFELTPDGVKLTSHVAEGESIVAKTGRKLDYAILGGLALVAVMIVADRLAPRSAPQTTNAPATNKTGAAPSVAVLPFLDLSPTHDQGYFSDGVSEEILNVLTRIPKLQVAGRTSSFSFKGKDEDMRKIGETLGVNHILEGSVRKESDELRITAQLIRASDGFHVWSESYDRKLTDVFEVQEDIARAVAGQLAVSLGLNSGDTLVKDRTKDSVAYEKYLRANELYRNRGEANMRKAQSLLIEVVARDPDFVEAWTLLAHLESTLPFYTAQTSEDPEAGEAAARRALALQPGDAGALAALGSSYLIRHELVNALDAFDRAYAASPRNPALLNIYPQIFLQTGLFEEAEEISREALAIDPLNVINLNALGWSLSGQGRYDEALKVWRRAIALTDHGNIPYPYQNSAEVYLAKKDAKSAYRMIADYYADRFGDEEEAGPNKAHLEIIRRFAAGELTAENILRDPKAPLVVKHQYAPFIDDAATMAGALEPYWSDLSGNELNIFGVTQADFQVAFSDPVWRKAVRDSGLLALWKKRGFPTFCHAVGDDDFQCVASEAIK